MSPPELELLEVLVFHPEDVELVEVSHPDEVELELVELVELVELLVVPPPEDVELLEVLVFHPEDVELVEVSHPDEVELELVELDTRVFMFCVVVGVFVIVELLGEESFVSLKLFSVTLLFFSEFEVVFVDVFWFEFVFWGVQVFSTMFSDELLFELGILVELSHVSWLIEEPSVSLRGTCVSGVSSKLSGETISVSSGICSGDISSSISIGVSIFSSIGISHEISESALLKLTYSGR